MSTTSAKPAVVREGPLNFFAPIPDEVLSLILTHFSAIEAHCRNSAVCSRFRRITLKRRHLSTHGSISIDPPEGIRSPAVWQVPPAKFLHSILRSVTHLRSLDLFRYSEELSPITSLGDLEQFSLETFWRNSPQFLLHTFPYMPNLTFVRLLCGPVPTGVISALAHSCPDLVHLELDSEEGDSPVASLASLKACRKLSYLEGAGLVGLEQLVGHCPLASLHFMSIPPEPHTICRLAPSLKELTLCHAYAEIGEALAAVDGLPRLEDLYLDFEEEPSALVLSRLLNHAPNVRSLHLGRAIPPTRRLIEALGGLRNLAELQVGFTMGFGKQWPLFRTTVLSHLRVLKLLLMRDFIAEEDLVVSKSKEPGFVLGTADAPLLEGIQLENDGLKVPEVRLLGVPRLGRIRIEGPFRSVEIAGPQVTGIDLADLTATSITLDTPALRELALNQDVCDDASDDEVASQLPVLRRPLPALELLRGGNEDGDYPWPDTISLGFYRQCPALSRICIKITDPGTWAALREFPRLTSLVVTAETPFEGDACPRLPQGLTDLRLTESMALTALRFEGPLPPGLQTLAITTHAHHIDLSALPPGIESITLTDAASFTVDVPPRLPALRTLTVEGPMTRDSLHRLVDGNPLHHLNLDEASKISDHEKAEPPSPEGAEDPEATLALSLPLVRSFNLNMACSLAHLALDLPRARTAVIKSCPRLVDTRLWAPRVESLQIELCAKLGLVELTGGCPHLASLAMPGILGLSPVRDIVSAPAGARLALVLGAGGWELVRDGRPAVRSHW
ncbi:hypothetical protein PAPYR_10346 [Paratrimastix pyriformis]|uniref:F-box domain-containing protein n=1 Tax=Paratrimastix pyriformis TaxID=342808 RepID=A0ABQ8U905_9EUKA|nr:hypothetical protein PAPYR_10346 [Paratrimastix pyriformis]